MKYMIIQLRILKISGLNRLKELVGLRNGIKYGIGISIRLILAGMKGLNLMHVIIALTGMLRMAMEAKLPLFGKGMTPLRVKN